MSVCLKKFAVCLVRHTFLQWPLNANNPFGRPALLKHIITYQSLLFCPTQIGNSSLTNLSSSFTLQKLNQILKSTQLKQDAVLLGLVSETRWNSLSSFENTTFSIFSPPLLILQTNSPLQSDTAHKVQTWNPESFKGVDARMFLRSPGLKPSSYISFYHLFLLPHNAS